MRHYLILLFVLSLVFTSCNNDSDTSGPAIDIISPDENQVLYTGNSFVLWVKVKDETSISRFQYQMYSEEHTDFNEKKAYDFDYILSEFTEGYVLSLPDSLAEGEYLIELEAVDMYNNKNQVVRKVRVEDEE